jgi:GIY-YIG catalytic domain
MFSIANQIAAHSRFTNLPSTDLLFGLKPTDGVAFVYRLYDTSGVLLYVGSTNRIHSRLRSHCFTKSWWSEVAALDLRPCPSRKAAFDLEAAFINELRPVHNIKGSPVHGPDGHFSASQAAELMDVAKQTAIDRLSRIAQPLVHNGCRFWSLEQVMQASEMAKAEPDKRRHGTVNRYTNHRCRCQPCRDAWAAFCRSLKERRAAALAEDPSIAPHGRTSTYRNYCCRCRPCVEAATEEQRQRLAKRKQNAD